MTLVYPYTLYNSSMCKFTLRMLALEYVLRQSNKYPLLPRNYEELSQAAYPEWFLLRKRDREEYHDTGREGEALLLVFKG